MSTASKKLLAPLLALGLMVALALGLLQWLGETPQQSIGIAATGSSGPDKPAPGQPIIELQGQDQSSQGLIKKVIKALPGAATNILENDPAPGNDGGPDPKRVMKIGPGGGPAMTRAFPKIDPEQQRKQIEAATGPRSILTGRIVDRQARPVANALVELLMVDRGQPMFHFGLQLPGQPATPAVYSVNSAEDGSFEFKAMPLEFGYQIRASLEPEFLGNTVSAPALSSQEKTPVGDIPLDRPANLEGRVLSEDGKPIPGALVKIQEKLFAGAFDFEDEDEDNGTAKHAVMIARTVVAKGSEGKGETVRVMTNFGPSTRSDDQGHFRFEKLKPGAYVLGAAKKGYRKLSSHPIDLAESQTARGVELRLGQPGRIFVKVTDEAGAPIVGASVRRRSSAMMFVSRSPSNPDPNGADAPRQTDAEGIALLEGIDATELAVEASAPGFATTSKTVSMTSFEVSIEMTLRPGRVLKGRLINAKTKAPVSEVHLNAFPKENTSPAEMTSNNATTDSDGRFEFGPLRPGEYVLSSFAPNLAPLNKRVELSSGEGPMVLPDIEMTEVRELAVRVLDPDGKALESASVRVYAIETAGIRRISFGTLTENQSDANGLITLSGLEPVRSHVSASKSGFGSGWLADQDLSDPSLQQLEIRLCRPASFEGTARDANGLPLSRTTISLLRLGFSQPIATLDTDSEGRFRFQDLGPGQYVLVRGAFPRAQPEDKDLITIVEAESLISDITLP